MDWNELRRSLVALGQHLAVPDLEEKQEGGLNGDSNGAPPLLPIPTLIPGSSRDLRRPEPIAVPTQADSVGTFAPSAPLQCEVSDPLIEDPLGADWEVPTVPRPKKSGPNKGKVVMTEQAKLVYSRNSRIAQVKREVVVLVTQCITVFLTGCERTTRLRLDGWSRVSSRRLVAEGEGTRSVQSCIRSQHFCVAIAKQ